MHVFVERMWFFIIHLTIFLIFDFTNVCRPSSMVRGQLNGTINKNDKVTLRISVDAFVHTNTHMHTRTRTYVWRYDLYVFQRQRDVDKCVEGKGENTGTKFIYSVQK